MPRVDAPNPASDVAGEMATALAASSIAFRSSDPGYSDTLLRNAINAFQFADSYRRAYSDNSTIRDGACPFYCDFDGYQVINQTSLSQVILISHFFFFR